MADRATGSQAEQLLADRLVAGDQAALSEIYDLHAGFVFALALRVIGDKGASEDVTQEVFLTIWTQPDRFDHERGSLRAFLGTLTHRRAVDHIRREEARRKREAKSTGEPMCSPGADDLLTDHAARDRVRAVVAALPEAQREALELAYFHGHTYRQVAAVLGIPEGTAKSRLRLALQRLAEGLNPEVSGQWT